MKQLWLIVHLKTIFRNDRTGFTCFCFHLKNIKSFEKQLKPVVLQRGVLSLLVLEPLVSNKDNLQVLLQ